MTLGKRRKHLLERFRSALHGEGQVTRQICHEYYPDGVIEVDAEAAGPCEDNADRHDDTGDSIGQETEQLKQHASSGLDLDDDIRHHNAEEHTDYTGGEGKEDGVLYGIHDHGIIKENILVIVKCKVLKGKGQTVGLEEADEDYHGERHDNDDEKADVGNYQQGYLCAAELYEHGACGFSLDDIIASRTTDTHGLTTYIPCVSSCRKRMLTRWMYSTAERR